MASKSTNAREKDAIENQKNKVGNGVTKPKWVQYAVTKCQGFSYKQKVKLAKTNGSRNTKQWLNLNITTPNQLVSTRQAENASAVTTASSVTTTTSVEGRNDDHDVDVY